MSEPRANRLSAALDEPLERLGQNREQLAKDWLLRLIARSPLDQIERMPTDQFARSLPVLIGAVLDALGRPEDGALLEPGGAAHDVAVELAQLRGADGPRALPADLASLQSVLLTGLRSELEDKDVSTFLDAVERLTAVIGALQAAAFEGLLGDPAEAADQQLLDPLTGLPGLPYLRARVEEMAAIARRYAHPFALLLVDVDGLDRINTAHGRQAGDAVLAALGGALRATIRDADLSARTGGDEFSILATQQTATRATVLAARLAAAAEALQAGDRIAVKVAIGIAGFPEHTDEPERLFELADEAMFRAKAAGEPWALGAPTR